MDATELSRQLLGNAPANVTLGFAVDKAVDGHAEVSLDVPDGLTNVIGSLHASGLAGLVDACGLAAIISAMPDEQAARDLQPLGRGAQLQFLAPAHGRLSATCDLSSEAWDELEQLRSGAAKVRFSTETTIVSDETAACCGRFEWSVRRAG